MIIIRPADFPKDAPLLRTLFREYAVWLGVDLDFQGFEVELANLPGAYAPPQGIALIAEQNGAAIGCVAMRPVKDDTCEMKRLWLRPEARGQGLGQTLAQRLFQAAIEAGYRHMVLDTLENMTGARRLYSRLGFHPIPAYYHNPLPGAVYLGRDLTQ